MFVAPPPNNMFDATAQSRFALVCLCVGVYFQVLISDKMQHAMFYFALNVQFV